MKFDCLACSKSFESRGSEYCDQCEQTFEPARYERKLIASKLALVEKHVVNFIESDSSQTGYLVKAIEALKESIELLSEGVEK